MRRTFLINGTIEFIVSEKKLTRLIDGHSLKLRAPAAFCLALLIEKQGELVTHSELYDYGWQRFGMSVSASVLHNTIFYLRQSLSKVGGLETGVIETIPRRGFVFSRKIDIHRNMLQGEEAKNEPEEDPIADISATEISQTMVSPIADTLAASDAESAGTSLKKSQHHRFAFQTGALAFALIACLIWIVFKETASRGLFPYNYDYVGEYGRCKLYQNRMGGRFADMTFAENVAQDCEDTPYIYVTSFLYSDRVSIIKCRSRISLFSSDACVSDYYLYKKNRDNDE